MKKGKNKGAKRYNVVFPKGKKKWVAKPIMEEKSYSFVQELMKEVLVCRNNGKKTKSTKPATIPKNIASFPLPSKDEIITKQKIKNGKKSNITINFGSTCKIQLHYQQPLGCKGTHKPIKDQNIFSTF